MFLSHISVNSTKDNSLNIRITFTGIYYASSTPAAERPPRPVTIPLHGIEPFCDPSQGQYVLERRSAARSSWDEVEDSEAESAEGEGCLIVDLPHERARPRVRKGRRRLPDPRRARCIRRPVRVPSVSQVRAARPVSAVGRGWSPAQRWIYFAAASRLRPWTWWSWERGGSGRRRAAGRRGLAAVFPRAGRACMCGVPEGCDVGRLHQSDQLR